MDMINLEESGVKWNAKPPRGKGREDEAGIWACRMEEKSFIRLGLIWPSAYKLKRGEGLSTSFKGQKQRKTYVYS